MLQHEGKTPGQLIFEATVNFYEGDRRFREILQERVRQADQGIFLEEEEMDARFKKLLQS